MVEKDEVDQSLLGIVNSRDRLKFADNFTTKKQFKSTGVKRVLVLASFPQIVGEKYEFIRPLIEKMGYDRLRSEHDLPTYLCSDLKVILVLVGQQTATATFPCPYCLKTRASFANPSLTPAKGRTFEGNYEFFVRYQNECGSNKQQAHVFFDVVNRPMGIFPEQGEILDSIPPPELHCMLGIGNGLHDELAYWDSVNNTTLVRDWSASLNLTREEYHGGQFESFEQGPP
jgi:hypothetical protein